MTSLLITPEGYYRVWFDLSDILELDWDKKAGKIERYVLSKYAYLFGDGNGSLPKNLPSWEDMNPWTSKDRVKVSWKVTYRELIGSFLQYACQLKTLVEEPKEIRFICYSCD